jgi:hypothetical protein
VTARKLKDMGVLPGVPDLQCLELLLFIEVKREVGILSSFQLEFAKRALSAGFNFITGYGFEDLCLKFDNFYKECASDEGTTLYKYLNFRKDSGHCILKN